MQLPRRSIAVVELVVVCVISLLPLYLSFFNILCLHLHPLNFCLPTTLSAAVMSRLLQTSASAIEPLHLLYGPFEFVLYELLLRRNGGNVFTRTSTFSAYQSHFAATCRTTIWTA
jgi:hypothetical protein